MPIDESGQLIPLGPSSPALATTYDTSISSATTITLDAETRFIRVYAIGETVFLKWGTGVTTSSDGFDEVILADSSMDWKLNPSQAGMAISVIERAASASVIVVEKK